MRLFRFLLLLCLPSLLFCSTPLAPDQSETVEVSEKREIFIPRDENGLIDPWGYFDPENMAKYPEKYVYHYLDFLDLICYEAFLETLSEEEIDRIIDFAIWVVRYSVPKNRPDLKAFYEEEISELLQNLEEEEVALANTWTGKEDLAFDFFQEDFKLHLCKNKKGWLKRKLHHAVHWCSKHKRPLIIGTVIIGTVAVVAITGGGGGAGVAIGGALIDSSSKSKEEEQEEAPSFENEVPFFPETPDVSVLASKTSPIEENKSSSSPSEENPFTPSLEEVEVSLSIVSHPEQEVADTLQEGHQIAKEEYIEGQERDVLEFPEKSIGGTFKEATLGTLSYILQDTIDDIVERAEIIFDPKTNPFSSKEKLRKFREDVAWVHTIVDKLLGTDLSEMYTEEAKEALLAFKEEMGIPDATIAEAPPPPQGFFLGKGSSSFAKLARRLKLARKVAKPTHPLPKGTIKTASVGEKTLTLLPSGDTKIPVTLANSTKGWKVGDPTNNLTKRGKLPTWNTVRRRYWKNEAARIKEGKITKALKNDCYNPTPQNIKRMEKGLAPQFEHPNGDLQSVELHHNPPQREGGLFDVTPMTPQQHAGMDPCRHLRGGKQ